ncbi:hypothetical protein L1987_63561 [Smallanthus sonchifolius]|uniref:Uncharacterized protein n=1 Tax=Smallanthus sonchifolius TaxID=185202 RepID=A0ACB9CDY4_9ASTR|nr:hypothetical protein L1987_63561 [Smallanthus sonchifolius]
MITLKWGRSVWADCVNIWGLFTPKKLQPDALLRSPSTTGDHHHLAVLPSFDIIFIVNSLICNRLIVFFQSNQGLFTEEPWMKTRKWRDLGWRMIMKMENGLVENFIMENAKKNASKPKMMCSMVSLLTPIVTQKVGPARINEGKTSPKNRI